MSSLQRGHGSAIDSSRQGLIDRTAATADRREIVLALTRKGQRIVDRVTQRRRAEIARILDRIPETQVRSLITALERFSDAAGEAPEQVWSLGWPTDGPSVS